MATSIAPPFFFFSLLSILSGWTMNAWSRFARQKVERVFTPIKPADSALWPLPGYADEETRVHLRPATTTAAAGAAGRRRRPLCDLGTGNFTRPPLPFTTRFGYLNARHGSETSTPAARRFVRLWTPVSDTTCVGTVRIPDTNARHSAAHVRLQAAPAHRSRLTCMPCGEFVRDGLVTTLARCPAAHRSLD